MAWGRDRGHPHPGSDLDGVAVADRGPFKGDVVVGVDVVGRAGVLGKCEPPRDVVVVKVGLEDVGQPNGLLL